MSSKELGYSNIKSSRKAPVTLRNYVDLIFQANEDACWNECLPYLSPPGIEGSTSWDQKAVIDIILRHDQLKGNGSHITNYMFNNGMTKVMLWSEVVKVIRKAGFDMRRGRLMGVLEHKPEESE
mgnify:CR=1 FL=1|jgi:hypothetical protein